MKKCIVCAKLHNRKENVCSIDCMDIYFFGSKEKAREAAINAFDKIGIKVK